MGAASTSGAGGRESCADGAGWGGKQGGDREERGEAHGGTHSSYMIFSVLVSHSFTWDKNWRGIIVES